jgi:hypothetical protein
MKQICLITWILVLPILHNTGSGIFRGTDSDQNEGIKNILVLSVAGNADSTVAVSMEKNLVIELRNLNYAAESAIEHFGKNAFSKIREEETIKQLYPYDAVIIVSLVDQNKIPKMDAACKDFFWEYYDSMYSAAHERLIKKAGLFFWEISFFDISTWKLQYRMKTAAFAQDRGKILLPAHCTLIIRNMLAKQIINPLPSKLKAF